VKYYTNKARQAGMTLIELTVVLLVLVGLAGLLIPYVSGFVTKTHDSTGASNIQALNNAMQRYSVEHYDHFPNSMDSLLQGATGSEVIFTKTMTEMMPGSFGKYFVAYSLDTAQAKSLTDAGISTLKQMDDTTGDATFANTAATDYSVVATTKVAKLDDTKFTSETLSSVMGKPLSMTNNHYFVFGLGDDSTIAGETVSDVPVHFARSGAMGANNAYNHFVTVFEVPKAAYCNVDAIVIADDGTGDGVATVVADITGAIDGTEASQADCDTNVATGIGANTDTVTGVTFVNPDGAVAKFVGTAMAMGMGNFEGLGGSLTRYYENSAQN